MYGKLFRQMFTSSIAEDRDARHVFMDLIILSDRNGVVDMTVEAIARVTNAPVEDIKAAIERLSAPDSRSRNPKEDGRRIVPLDEGREWGWQIVNYEEYRDMRDTEGRTEYMRRYIRDYRASGKDKRRGKQGKRGKRKVNTGKRGLANVPPDVDVDVDTVKKPVDLSFLDAEGYVDKLFANSDTHETVAVWLAENTGYDERNRWYALLCDCRDAEPPIENLRSYLGKIITDGMKFAPSEKALAEAGKAFSGRAE